MEHEYDKMIFGSFNPILHGMCQSLHSTGGGINFFNGLTASEVPIKAYILQLLSL